jgi:hypothetical protein
MSEINTDKKHQKNLNPIKANRIEVIDHSKSFEQGGGRVFVKSGFSEVEMSYQDDGKTLKLFIK